MNWTPAQLPYRQTGYFSKIMIDYLCRAGSLAPFYTHPVSPEGIQSSIQARQKSPVNRQVLVDALKEQYRNVEAPPPVQRNLERLLQENTFTIVTAHQPAIFTGTLYFIYKILHTIKLAERLAVEHPQHQFVPVFFMGSEDADLDELGNIYLDNEKLVWNTKQTGAVGRMKPKGLEKIIDRIEGEFSVLPFGKELIQLLKEAYLESPDIQTATFRLLHRLFAEYGLIILIPDNVLLKRLMVPVFEDDLFNNTPSVLVDQTVRELSQHYKVQANPRAINLFYLKDDLRGRIERVGDQFIVHDSKLVFDESSIRRELQEHPERFSPNVILRGLFQETILPNIAFIGGGGEMAYWLELKSLFSHYKVAYPMLVLRNSFLLIEQKWNEKIKQIGFSIGDLFRPEEELVNELVKQRSQHQLTLEKEISEARQYYEKLSNISGTIDPTLLQHVEALEAKAIRPLQELEKKLLKAEKRKFKDHQRQIHLIKSALFPFNNLQERVDNFLPWYAGRGKKFIADIYEFSLTLEQEFMVLTEE